MKDYLAKNDVSILIFTVVKKAQVCYLWNYVWKYFSCATWCYSQAN